jgi:hypothetical protein
MLKNSQVWMKHYPGPELTEWPDSQVQLLGCWGRYYRLSRHRHPVNIPDTWRHLLNCVSNIKLYTISIFNSKTCVPYPNNGRELSHRSTFGNSLVPQGSAGRETHYTRQVIRIKSSCLWISPNSCGTEHFHVRRSFCMQKLLPRPCICWGN